MYKFYLNMVKNQVNEQELENIKNQIFEKDKNMIINMAVFKVDRDGNLKMT